jgi:hypothetical protein
MPNSSDSIDPRGTAALVSTLLEALRRSDAVSSGGLFGLPVKIGVSIEPGEDGTTAVTVEVKGRPPAEAMLDRASRPTADGTVAGLEWNRPGHGVVAYIAMQRLGQTHPGIANAIDALLEKDPRGRTSIADLAAWPDTIKRGTPDARPETAAWHFIDIPFDVDNPAAPPKPPAGPSLLTAIPAQIEAFNQATSVQDRLDALAFVLHLIGDLHQPLHCATRISPQHPQGDRGGNGFAILGPRVKDDRGHSARLTNLHAFWDAALNITGPADAQQKAQQLVAANPAEHYADRLAIKDVRQCAIEAFGIAKTAVYAGIEENPASPPEPSKAYIKRAIQVAADQGLVGGYRLADVLGAQLLWPELARNGVSSHARRRNGASRPSARGSHRITA